MRATSTRQHCMKVLLLGPENVGKTALLRNIMHKAPDQTYEKTIGMEFAFRIDHPNQFKAHFYDVSGERRFRFIVNTLLAEQKINCILLMIDNIDSLRSLEFIRDTLSEIDKQYEKNYVDNKPVIGLLVNKRVISDAASESPLYFAIADHYYHRFQFMHYCSVLDTAYPDILFNKLSEMAGALVTVKSAATTLPMQNWGDYLPEMSGYFNLFCQKKSGVPLLITAPPKKSEQKEIQDSTSQLTN